MALGFVEWTYHPHSHQILFLSGTGRSHQSLVFNCQDLNLSEAMSHRHMRSTVMLTELYFNITSEREKKLKKQRENWSLWVFTPDSGWTDFKHIDTHTLTLVYSWSSLQLYRVNVRKQIIPLLNSHKQREATFLFTNAPKTSASIQDMESVCQHNFWLESDFSFIL